MLFTSGKKMAFHLCLLQIKGIKAYLSRIRILIVKTIYGKNGTGSGKNGTRSGENGAGSGKNGTGSGKNGTGSGKNWTGFATLPPPLVDVEKEVVRSPV